jgi:hypothetical protein
MIQKPTKVKNNNLSIYKQKMQERNEALVRRAVEHILKLDGEISFSMVSKVTYDISDGQKDEKGLTLAAISKNKLYRSIIEKAKESQLLRTNGEYKHSSGIKHSIGDMQMLLHELRVQNVKLKQENKILSGKLKETTIPLQEVGHIEESIVKKAKAIQNIANSLVQRLLELELVYIDTDDSSLKVAIYNQLIANAEALSLFFQKDIHESYTIR